MEPSRANPGASRRGAVIVVILLAVIGMVAYFTDGFGLASKPKTETATPPVDALRIEPVLAREGDHRPARALQSLQHLPGGLLVPASHREPRPGHVSRERARAAARKARDFKEADRLRDDLKAKGVILEDGPKGTTWKRG